MTTSWAVAWQRLARRQDMSTTDLEPGNTPTEEGVLALLSGHGVQDPKERPRGPTSTAQYWAGFHDGLWLGGRGCNSASPNLPLALADLIHDQAPCCAVEPDQLHKHRSPPFTDCDWAFSLTQVHWASVSPSVIKDTQHLLLRLL